MVTQYNHGVLYSPSSADSPPKYVYTIQQLKDLGISYIEIHFVDLTNVRRFRVLPISYFEKLLQSPRPGINIAKIILSMVYLNAPPGASSIGEYLFVPDMDTIRICPYNPGHASVFGWFQEKAPYTDSDGNLSLKVNLCPRSVLKRVVEDARRISQVEFLVGFETEFILLKSTDPIEPVNIHSFTTTDGLLAGTPETAAIQEIVDSLLMGSIEVQMYHPEAAPGQYEIVTGPLKPLEAADALIYTRETIMHVAAKHGLRATFAPRVFMSSVGSGAHTNISVHHIGTSQKTSDSLSTHESYFLAGVLKNLPSLPAITAPIPASWLRLVDGAWSGGTYVCWGTENREAPIRLVNRSSPTSRRFEMRFVDATAQPHLVLAAILGSGHAGIQKTMSLDVKDCCGQLSAAQMDEEGRNALGITKRMPLNWNEAREALENSQQLEAIFGAAFISHYLAVNKVLGDQLSQDNDEMKALTRLVKFY